MTNKQLAELETYLDQCFTQRSHAETSDQYEYFDKQIAITIDQLKFERLCKQRVDQAVALDTLEA